MHRQRTTGLLIVAIAVSGALVWGFWPRPILVEAAQAVRAPMNVTVEEEGLTRVKDRFVISAPVAGYLQRIQLDVGDMIEQGQVLAVLEPLRPEVLDTRSRARAEAQVAAAAAAHAAAKEQAVAAAAEAQLARRENLRNQKLRKDSLVSQDALDQSETRLHRADAGRRSADFAVEVARFDLEAARTALKYSIAGNGGSALETVRLRAPVSSRVLRIHQESEGVVSAGGQLLEIGDPAALEIAVDVLSKDAVRILPGSMVKFYRWGGDEVLEGTVRTVEPAGFTKISALGVEEQRVWVIADLRTPYERWRQLGDGYRVEAHFILWEAEDVLQVPASALFRAAGGWAVFKISAGRARQVSVATGHNNGLAAQIVSGLSAGGTVIVHPDDRIRDGIRVVANKTVE
ncbi:MAG: HlyD family efflux transporter periplasmic adaptor subunit [Gammaproteobacteria bacterium]